MEAAPLPSTPAQAADDGELLLRAIADGRPHLLSDLVAALGFPDGRLTAAARGLCGLGVALRLEAGSCRLDQPVELLEQDSILAALPAGSGFGPDNVHVCWRPGSTSDLARTLLAAAPDRPVAVIAESQESGRGRRGRAWLDAPGAGICLSIGRRLELAARDLGGLSLAVGVEIVHALEARRVPGLRLKWPNDVVADGAKLAGILVEMESGPGGGVRVVVGIGLNLRLPPAVREDLDQAVTDLASRAPGAEAPRNALAAAILAAADAALRRFASDGFAPFAAAFARHDALVGEELEIITPDGRWLATGAGVDAGGALCVRRAGELLRLHSAEVSVRRR